MVNVLPYGAVHWAGRMVGNPAIRASVRLLTGVASFPATWVLTAWLLPWDAWWVTVLVLVVAPTSGLIAVGALDLIDRATDGARSRIGDAACA